MKIDVLQKDPLSMTCDVCVVSVFQGSGKLIGAAANVDRALDGALSQLIAQDHFEGKFGQSLIFPTFGKLQARRVVLLGLGERKKLTLDALRKIGGCIVKLSQSCKAASAVTILHGVGAGELDSKNIAQALAEGAALCAYRFHVYHGTLKKKDAAASELQTLLMCEPEARAARAAEEGVARAGILTAATISARDLVNTPSADMTPLLLADAAKKLMGKGVTVKILDRAEMERLGMHATLAVARGSEHSPVGVHLSYKPQGAKKRVVLVGKAVTFDSGGLSIKPADGMMTMKIDMAGAATVVGVFKALAELKLPVEVHGIFLAVENMPGGRAYRPGDVVKAMDGTTIEILNTDAEGRVTLADALSYARTLEPNMIIDLATLTGACVVALGEDIAGLLSNDTKLAQRLLDAAEETGEPLWQLPLYEPYMEHVKSKIADLKNIGSRGQAGTISAALFLKPFVGDIPWAHLDIAGPSYTERETRPDQPYGASGYGVRLLLKFLQKL